MDAWLRNQIGNLATLRRRCSLRLAGGHSILSNPNLHDLIGFFTSPNI